MNAITIIAAVYFGGIVLIWLWIGAQMTKAGAQSQHGGELIGCLFAFLWPLAPFAWLVSRLRGE